MVSRYHRMGNTESATNSENGEEDTPKEPTLDKEQGVSDGSLDLIVLFDPKQLRAIADKVKDDSAVNPLQQHHPALVRWLEERRSRGVESITMVQFVDSFTNKGVSKQIATEIFQQFDIEGNGVVDLDYLHEMMDLTSRSISGFTGVRSDLQAVNKLLQDCCLAPGFIDAFTCSKTMQVNHGQKLFKFLSRNRALSRTMPLPALKGFITTTDMRLKVLKAHLNAVKERDDNKKREPSLQADEVLKPINRCFTSADVSSNRADASKLIDNDNGTYWQSDGPARSHWVRLKIPPNVVVKQLSMYVVSSDQSYMPHHVVIYGGRDESNLQELDDVNIPNHITGDFTLLENVKMPYQVIQISIKRCHSDGCDTRIRQIKAIGYRVVKSKGVSVMDATAMWYLSVLAATAQAALPVAPHLRESIITHTRTSLSHMGPLSLSLSSNEKPGFLSTNVMEQMEGFLHSIICMNGSPPAEDLVVLLEFSMSRGSLGSIMDTLKLLLAQVKLKYPAVPLLQNLSETEDKAVRRHGQKLSAVILSCDGGCKDEGTSPAKVLSDNWKTEAYFTATGKIKCNMAFGLKSGNLIQLTRVFMKLSKGAIGPKAGMIFVFDSDNIKDENGTTLFQPLEECDSWTENDYLKFKETSRGEKDWKPFKPVAYFTVDKDWADVDVAVDRIQVGSCVAIKFLGPRQESAERLGIIGINLYGYEQNEDSVAQSNNLECQTQVLPEDEDAYISGVNVLLRTLRFLQIMCRDAVNIKSHGTKDVNPEKDTTMDIHDVNLDQIWCVYKLIGNSELSVNQSSLASEMALNLFHIALPYLKPSVQKLRESRKIQQRGKKLNREQQEKEIHQFSSEVFQSLCDIVDEQDASKGVHKSAKDIILDGAELFFPDAKTRRAHLLSLVDKVMEDGKAVSLAYTFESLCRFFSNKDASGLLGLPDSLPQVTFQPESVVYVMKTLVSVAYRESLSQVKHDAGSEAPSNLVLLLCAMQKSLLAWCHTQCLIDSARQIAFEILVQYVEMISDKCSNVLMILEESNDKVKIVDRLEYSFVSMAMRQLILFLNLFASMDIDFICIIRHLQSLSYTLASQSALLPQLFSKAMGDDSSKNQENTVLREWEVESEHDYENNMHFTQVFNCTGCTRFRVEFDSNCQTERRFDYLEFSDSSGCKRRFDVCVGTDIWPSTVEFNAGQKLHFLFHSDGSNTSWGYKFKVFAIGSPDVAVSWIFDLQLNLARCFGIFCGNALNSETALSMKRKGNEENEEERALLHSELWGSLFRGGYMIGKLERSLSGFHKSSHFDSNTNSFLCELAACETERTKAIIERCQSHYTGQKIGGGILFDSAVNAVFSALLWHTQELRETAAKLAGENICDMSPSIMHAYTVAESVRRPLLESRQKLLVQQDEPKDNSGHFHNPDNPVISCREKALFLLKFAGLCKIKSRKLSFHSAMEHRNSVLNRPRSFVSQESCDSKRNSGQFQTEEQTYPSFQLILDFVTNESLSHIKIQDLLQHRCKYANNINSIYNFASDYIEQMVKTDNTQIPIVLFLQNMLSSQDQFPLHYADCLNGCGLALENLVRKSFYGFIRRLSEVVAHNMHRENINSLLPLFRCVLAYLLHFLDVEWKPYDYDFLIELNIPFLLVASMQGMKSPLANIDSDAELEMLERHKRFFREARDQSIDNWCERNRGQAPLDIQRDINLFIARYSSDLDVVITCDGCSDTIRGGRYRCLQCIDMDLCSTCFLNGIQPNEHSPNHKVIHLRYTCDSCGAFIIETRIHCNICTDFDLCLACHKSDTYPTYHSITHSVTKSNLIPEGLSPVKSSYLVALKTYVQQHSWLQFCAIALSLSESLQTKKAEGVEIEYMKAARMLLLDCLQKLVDCLNSPSRFFSFKNSAHSLLSSSKVKFEDSERVLAVTSVPGYVTEHPLEPSRDTTNMGDCPFVFYGTESDNHPVKSQIQPIQATSFPTITSAVENNDSHYVRTSEDVQIPSIPDLEEPFDAMIAKSCMHEGTLSMENSDKHDIVSNNDITLKCTELKDDTSVHVGSSFDDSDDITEGTSSLNELRVNNAEGHSDILVCGPGKEIEDSTFTEQVSDILTAAHSEETNDLPMETNEPAMDNNQISTSEPILESPETKSDVKEKEGKKIENKNDTKTENAESEKLNSELFFQEKIIGLIGALIPQNREVSSFPAGVEFQAFFSTQLLPVLFRIISNIHANIRIRMVALGIMVKILLCFGPEVGDRAVGNVIGDEGNPEKTPGGITVNFLFRLGADCLKNANLDAASGVETALKSLWTNEKWKECISAHANETLKDLSKESMDPPLMSLFSLMLLAGFPDILHTGSLAQIKEIGGEVKQVVVDKPAEEQTIVINLKNRKKMTVKEASIEATETSGVVFDSSRIILLVEIIKKIVSHKGSYIGALGLIASVEQMWVLGLICKALLCTLKAEIDKEIMMQIIASEVIPCIVNLACQGTGFSKQWMLRDLEVLSWKIYKIGEDVPAESLEIPNKLSSINDLIGNSGESNGFIESKSPLHGLDEETKLCMETIHDALHCPYPILRAIYEHNGKNRDKLLEEVQRSFDGTAGCSIRASSEIRELAKQWEQTDVVLHPEASLDSSLDVGILKFQPKKVEFKDLQAKPEGGENSNKLISSLTEEEINETMARQQRIKSSELLKKEIEMRHDNFREYTKKVNFAVSVGYARKLAGWLFASWPETEDVISAMLGNINPQNIVGLLDLIQATENKDHFKMVVFNFIRCCNRQLVQPLALSAVQCMGEVRLATEVKESDHKYKNNAKVEDKVRITGATSLFIRFDDRCSTEYNCDELVMSSSPLMQQNRRVFSGVRDWHDFEMPGDTVYYKFTSDSSNTDWGWRFTVTGGQLGRFETGCSILSALLDQDLHFARRLPLRQLWSWLIVVACNQVGQQRLMATGLLLRILQICAGDPVLFGQDVEPTPEKCRPNLSYLRPLWTLYTNAIESDTGTNLALMSPLIRALSELFLVVENVAQDWGEADTLVAGLATDDKMRKCFTKIVGNIAAIGLAINLPNKAIHLIKNAPEYIPQNIKDNVTRISRANRDISTIELRIANLASDDSDDDMTFDNDTTQDEEDDEDDEEDEDDDDDEYDDRDVYIL